jgi:hypothetical protein
VILIEDFGTLQEGGTGDLPVTASTTYQLVTDRNSDFDWEKLTLGPYKKVGLVTYQTMTDINSDFERGL